jgi:hypothetical protein
VILVGIYLYSVVGLLIGAFNGAFVDPLNPKVPIFSVRHALVGAILIFGLIVLGDGVFLLSLHDPVKPAVSAGAILGPVGGLAAGLWRFVNRGSAGRSECRSG